GSAWRGSGPKTTACPIPSFEPWPGTTTARSGSARLGVSRSFATGGSRPVRYRSTGRMSTPSPWTRRAGFWWPPRTGYSGSMASTGSESGASGACRPVRASPFFPPRSRSAAGLGSGPPAGSACFAAIGSSGSPLRAGSATRRSTAWRRMEWGACFRDTRGRLWFGSIGGAAEVDPARIAPRPPPRVAWTGASLGGLPVVLPSPGVSLHLPPGAGSLALSWIGVDIATPEAVIYQTRFAGLDSAWTPTDRRTVQLASPAPGSYRFEVRAARRGGEWSPILALDFVAEAPLWRRGWFRLIVALALL